MSTGNPIAFRNFSQAGISSAAVLPLAPSYIGDVIQ